MRAAALCLLVLVPGCVLPAGGGGPSAECRQGPEPFVRAQHHPGFITPDYQFMFYTLDRDGTLTYVRANESGSAAGTGQVRPVSGALHNVTLAQVRAHLQDHGAYRSNKDYQVSVAWRDTAAPSRFEAFCGIVLDGFYAYEARYNEDNVADCDGFTFKVHTVAKGSHESYSYCGAGPQAVRESFDAMVDDARRRLGIEGL